ncbi:hypothetical protein [Lentiprolixibacter aurantiacus]|uniref:DUF4625 domain-containing protein n=1 Tax=Lentiprolixibacter aurantiacus TaxID=2993939 RepID=A0AAE3MKW1_9FLAO|nr:hypothetical protein [Lentiprolixibacter aurantiacus]MCX2719298.1 hypothetical protein [Lentiprolixibacter aurantiacus]
MKRCIFLIAVLVLANFSCTDQDDDLAAVNIRVKNVSGLVFDSVLVGESTEAFTDLVPDDYSEYQEFDTAYTYAFIQITSGEEIYTLQPIDFVGETPLPFGFYTYELDVTDTGTVLLTFVID